MAAVAHCCMGDRGAAKSLTSCRYAAAPRRAHALWDIHADARARRLHRRRSRLRRRHLAARTERRHQVLGIGRLLLERTSERLTIMPSPRAAGSAHGRTPRFGPRRGWDLGRAFVAEGMHRAPIPSEHCRGTACHRRNLHGCWDASASPDGERPTAASFCSAPASGDDVKLLPAAGRRAPSSRRRAARGRAGELQFCKTARASRTRRRRFHASPAQRRRTSDFPARELSVSGHVAAAHLMLQRLCFVIPAARTARRLQGPSCRMNVHRALTSLILDIHRRPHGDANDLHLSIPARSSIMCVRMT